MMNKKIISISVFLAFAISLGLVGCVGIANADYDAVQFDADTSIDIEDLVISSGGKVAGIEVNVATTTITLESQSTITFTSASGKIMQLDHASAGTNECLAGGTSRLIVTYDSSHPVVILSLTGSTCTTYTLTEVNVAASPLTADTASAYTVTFKTANDLTSGQKIQLDFGTGFTIADSTSTAKVTTLTDDGSALSVSALDASSTAKSITITVGADVASSSVINIVLDSTLVTNPSTASADTSVSGIDIYTTDSGGTAIDTVLNQTAFNRVLDLVSGWNIFAPSQTLESAAVATVMTPISGTSTYDALYTLAWDSTAETMTWQTPTTIDPLYGYAIHNKTETTKKLPFDFAKESISNSTFERALGHAGWYLIGYTGSSASLVAQTYCLDGLTINGQEYFSRIVDLTGTTADGSVPTSHLISNDTTYELAATTPAMKFARDYGYAIFRTAAESGINIVLGGDRSQ